MSRTLQLDMTGIEKEQAHAHELAPSVPAEADNKPTAIVAKNIRIVKREFPARRWVNWGINAEKPKFPYTPETLRPAKAGNPETWGELSTALQNVKSKTALGIGFQFNGDGLWGVDLDHAIDPETRIIAGWAKEIIAELDTYTELSPSGTGFHLIAKAPGFSADRHKRAVSNTPGVVEVYGSDRYFTITANIFDGRDTIEERPSQLLSVYNRFLNDTTSAKKTLQNEQAKAPSKAEQEDYINKKIMEKTQNGDYERAMMENSAFQRAYNGEHSDRSKNPYHFGRIYAYWMFDYPGSWSESDLESAFDMFSHAPAFARYEHNDSKLKPNGGYRTTIHRSIANGFRDQTSTAREKDRLFYRQRFLASDPSSVLSTGMGDSSLEYPDTVMLKNGTIRPTETIDNFRVCLKKYGVEVAYNTLTKEVIPPTSISDKYTPVAVQTALLSYCQDLCAREQIPKTRDRVAGWLTTIANENRVHPVQQYLEALPVINGTDEIKRLFCCLKLDEDANRAFSYRLLKKWLIQCVAMAYNNDGSYGGEGVLVLQSAEGRGKTTFFRNLCKSIPSAFKEGAEQNSDKDKLIENTRYWITELGEIERSTLKELGTLKAFITNGIDEYRAPYGTASAKYPRFTSFCGTVNDSDFLRAAGRRFWVIPLEDIDLEALRRIDIDRVWAEAFALWKENPLAFRLGKEEIAAVIKLSAQFEKTTTEEATLLDMLDFSAPRTVWTWKTATEIGRQVGISDAAKMGRALRKIGYGRDSEEHPFRIKDGRSTYFVPPFIMPQF